MMLRMAKNLQVGDSIIKAHYDITFDRIYIDQKTHGIVAEGTIRYAYTPQRGNITMCFFEDDYVSITPSKSLI